ncbi:MAG TPA: ABC transporter substrate-binding protein [Pyrinomonadaceae bacterium]|nr:ABC transporter substrate-binding protein [Pyrinomonadaceae bacterium]
MPSRKVFVAMLSLLAIALLILAGCRGGDSGRTQFVTVLDANPATLDPLDGTDAASERLRQLMFNSLLRKNEKFEYVGDLASDYKTSEDGKTVTFTLNDKVTFHDGKPLTSADAKYTLDSLFASKKKKAAPFFESVPTAGAGGEKANTNRAGGGAPANTSQPYIVAVETPDALTLVIRLRKPWLSLLGNLVSVPIIPQGSADAQKTRPVGSGPFKFVGYDESQQVVDLAAYENYWQGAPQIKELRVRTILDANTLQAELQSGRIDIAPGASNLSPDSFNFLGQDSKLKVEKFPGANIVYLGFNVERPPLNNVKLRQAIAYAIDRESIVRDLMLGQARIAHSILPESSWAYDASQKYAFDPARAKQLLDEAGMPDPDGDGPRMRFDKPISFKITSGNSATSQYAGVIQNALKSVGIPVEIETLETNTLLPQLSNGQFEMMTLRWVGGNQDPVFLRDLFHSSEIPSAARTAARNRGRYRNAEFDRAIDEAMNTLDREKAKASYAQAQQILSRDLPMIPLWYPDVMVISRKGVGNIKVDASNDYSFLRSVTVQQ